MINKIDLKIGNKISLTEKTDSPIVTVKEILDDHATFVETWLFGRTYDRLMPIPIEYEWLNKFNFVKENELWWYNKYYVNIRITCLRGKWTLYKGSAGAIADIDYIHQLQNGFYFLSGRIELQLK